MSNPATLRLEFQAIIEGTESHEKKFAAAAASLRQSGPCRWVGLYRVDYDGHVVRNLVWNGPSAPVCPDFPIDKGLTGSAIRDCRRVNVGNVQLDPRYLTALSSTQSEIIIPIFDSNHERVVGTIDIERERANAFGNTVQAVMEACAEVLRVPLAQKLGKNNKKTARGRPFS